MTWFKVDDKLHDHRKARAAGATAMGVWCLAGSWAADNLTDGFIPATILPRWGRPRDANRLVEVGLWHADEQDGEKGWRFHEWHERQPSRAQKLEEREAKVAAGRAGGLASASSRRQKGADSGGSLAAAGRKTANSEPASSHNQADEQPTDTPLSLILSGSDQAQAKQSASGLVEPPSRPDPSRPTDADASVSPRAADAETPPRFEEFWETYSHKVGRQPALKAYRAALKKPGVTPDLLIATAAAYITYQMAEGKHPQFTKHAATWLHGEHWRDERADVRAPQTRVQEHLALVRQLAEEDEQQQPTIPQIGERR